MEKLSETECWRAIEMRDATFDGRFVYGVITTGVYCRPSCPSRGAKRENIRFFATLAAAEASGFRPCMRCRPLEQTGRDNQAAQMNTLAQFIETHAEEPLPLERLAREAGLSPYYLQRRFKAAIGLTPKAYQNAMRLKKLKTQLRAGDDIAILIPCHRVRRGDGSLGGYRWGAERKRALIEAERHAHGKGEILYEL